MTFCGLFWLVFLILFTALDLAGFWICRHDREGFRENILLVIINIGTVIVSWVVVLATLAGRGEI